MYNLPKTFHLCEETSCVMHTIKQDLHLLMITVEPRLVDVSDVVVASDVDTNVLSGVPEEQRH
jgi:hypothetical protein